MSTTKRLLCCVPFCRRTRADDGDFVEWMCGDHYRLVDRRLKTLRSRIRRRCEKIVRGADYRRGWVHLRVTRAHHTDNLLWDRMKRQAIERAAGIA